MSYLMSAFLGLVQGVAEFLPISSSGHLSILQNFFGVENSGQGHMLFDVLLHLGTLISVLVFYRREVLALIREFFALVAALFDRSKRGGRAPAARRLIYMIVIATLPLFVVVFINDYVEQLYYNTLFIGCALLVTGSLLSLTGRLSSGKKTEETAGFKDALFVGCAQALAVVPGLSRSGCTITAGLMRGYSNDFAVRFSFLLSIPAILGANILTISDALKADFDASMLPVYGVGMLVAAVSGYFAIALVKKLTAKGGLKGFSWYCWAVGALAIILTIAL